MIKRPLGNIDLSLRERKRRSIQNSLLIWAGDKLRCKEANSE
jgi:hypothetical protein